MHPDQAFQLVGYMTALALLATVIVGWLFIEHRSITRTHRSRRNRR